MKKYNPNRISISLFIVPYLIFVVLYSTALIWFGNIHLSTFSHQFETDAAGIAQSYAKTIGKSEEARRILNEMLESRLAVAGESIAMYEGVYSEATLKSLAKRYRVDEIYIYSKQGVVIYTNGKYLGWKAFKGHPVYEFMVSGETSRVEEIRPDSETGTLYKYAYYMMPNGTFVQIGVLADKVEAYLGRFDAETLINNIKMDGLADQVFFIDNHNMIVYGTAKGAIPKDFLIDTAKKNLDSSTHSTATATLEGKQLNLVFVPVTYDKEKIGTLVFGKSIDKIDAYMRNFVLSSILNFIIISIVIGIILFTAYKISKRNYFIAYYDQLTGLPNQYYMLDFLEKKIKNETTRNKAIFMINCMNFKRLNLVYGYDYGNNTIKEIADILGCFAKNSGDLFRFELDRFIIYLEDYNEIHELEAYAQKIGELFKNPITSLGWHLYIDVAVGIVEINQEDTGVQGILKKSVIAVDHVKKNALNYCFYDQEMESKLQRKETIERALRSILEQEGTDSFYLEFQPQLDVKTNKISGFEALARMESSELGIVSPVEFIKVAEEKLLIEPLGYLIINKAALFLKEIMEKGFDHIKVAVNVSGFQLLREDFADKFIEIIGLYHICNSCFEIEITESVFLDNYKLVNEKLEALTSRSIEVSLDDFGTGYSSLSNMRDLSINTVKIDRSFISKINQLQDIEPITADVISLAHKLGLKVVAEGVETEIQRKYLADHDCDIIQGYLFSKPLAHSKAVELLQEINQ